MKIKIIKPKSTANYRMPTTVYFGRGAVGRLPEIIKKRKAGKKILLIVDENFKKEAWLEEAKKKLQNSAQVVSYAPIIKKTDESTIDGLLKFCRRLNPDIIVGIGGGTIMDAAKCAAILLRHEGMVKDYLRQGRQFTKKNIFFVAVPTTAGTGSEVTPWATVWGSDNRKYSLSSEKFMFADIAIVDPALTDTLPKKITAETGIDALCQAIESFWNINHNTTSDRYALRAIKIILKNLGRTVNKPNKTARDEMLRGALMAGLAFSNTKTTICHAISYPMTAHWGIAHGQAVALTMPSFIKYSLPVLKNDRRKNLLKAFGARNEKEAAAKIENLMKFINLKTKISELNMPNNCLAIIIAEGYHPERAKNAPRIPSPQELRDILESIF